MESTADVYMQGMHEIHVPISTCTAHTYTRESSAVGAGITGTEHQSILEHKSHDGDAAEIFGVQGETVHQTSDDMASEDGDTDTAYLRAIEEHEAQRCASSSAPYLPAVPTERGARGIVAIDESRRFLGHPPLVARPALNHAPALKPHTENKHVAKNVPTGSAAHAATTAAAGTSPPPPRSA